MFIMKAYYCISLICKKCVPVHGSKEKMGYGIEFLYVFLFSSELEHRESNLPLW